MIYDLKFAFSLSHCFNSKFDETEMRLEINWSDEHSSSFDYLWLMDRNFSHEAQQHYMKSSYRPTKSHWSKSHFVEVFVKFDFKELIECDKVFPKWLEHLAVHAIALIENTPNTRNEVRKLAERVGFVRETHYGDEFTVAKKEQTTTFAYTPSKLQLHCDIPYYEYMPGVNMLHCLTQSKTGGGNTLVDGFYVAELLRKRHPKHFDVLTRVKINIGDYGEELGSKYEMLLRAPIIRLV